MSEQTKFIAKLGDGRMVEFNSRQDALLFAANFSSYIIFLGIYMQVYDTERGANIQYRNLRGFKNRKELLKVMQNTYLSDGSTLFEAVRSQSS